MTALVRWKRGLILAFSIMGAASFGTSCQPRRSEPEEALLAFLSDLRNGRADPAWAALTTASQKDIERRHAALRGTAETAPPKPGQLLFEDLGLMMVSEPETIAVASPPGDDVRLRVSVKDGRSADVRMVLEGGRWRVDLLSSLHPAPALSERLGEKTETATTPGP